jgi:ribonuclease HI
MSDMNHSFGFSPRDADFDMQPFNSEFVPNEFLGAPGPNTVSWPAYGGNEYSPSIQGFDSRVPNDLLRPIPVNPRHPRRRPDGQFKHRNGHRGGQATNYPRPPMEVMWNSNPIVLFYGGAVRRESLIGGCSWLLVDMNRVTIASGSYSVLQTFPSLCRLEFEGLLNGLQAAFLKNMNNIIIRGPSTMIHSFFSGDGMPASPHLAVMYRSVEDLIVAIRKLLPRFKYQFELIHKDENLFAQRLASNVISEYFRKKDMKLARQMSQESKKASYSEGSSPSPSLEESACYRDRQAYESPKSIVSNSFFTNNHVLSTPSPHLVFCHDVIKPPASAGQKFSNLPVIKSPFELAYSAGDFHLSHEVF